MQTIIMGGVAGYEKIGAQKGVDRKAKLERFC